MDQTQLIELLTGGSPVAILAVLLVWQLFRTEKISDGRIEDLKNGRAIAEQNAVQMERLTEAISRQTEAIARLCNDQGRK